MNGSARRSGQGSIRSGLLIALMVLIASLVLAGLYRVPTSHAANWHRAWWQPSMAHVWLYVPPLAEAAAAAVAWMRGHRRTAQGIVLGYLAAVGLVLLLFSACYGLGVFDGPWH